MKPLQRTRNDAELGPVRWCTTCAEWWPDDEEFWNIVPAGTVARNRFGEYVRKTDVKRCRAHKGNEGRVRPTFHRRRSRYHIPNAHQCRSTSGCIVIVPPARDLCYGCRGLTDGPLTVDRLAALGMAPVRRVAA